MKRYFKVVESMLDGRWPYLYHSLQGEMGFISITLEGVLALCLLSQYSMPDVTLCQFWV